VSADPVGSNRMHPDFPRITVSAAPVLPENSGDGAGAI